METARRHVPALTATLTLVSLALVFGAVLQLLPIRTLPHSAWLLAAIPHLNAAISLAAIAAITAGVYSIRRGAVGRHRALMVSSFLLFVAFLSLYLYRVAIVGPTEFTGPAALRTFVYLPVLGVHILLAMVCVPFVFYALLLAVTRPTSELSETAHATVGRIAASLWVISFSMGVVVYVLLHVLY